MSAQRSDKGFTLLEVMVALAIIATALVTLLGTHMMSLNLAQKNKEQSICTFLARQKMEELYTIPFDSVANDSGNFGADYPHYEWELDVEKGDIENLKKVKIIVKYPGGQFELETCVAKAAIE